VRIGRKFLWILLIGTLIPIFLIAMEKGIGGFAVERMLSFSPFARDYWFPVCVALWMLMVPLASLHALANCTIRWWLRILFVLLFVALGPIAIPIYCLVYLHRPEEQKPQEKVM